MCRAPLRFSVVLICVLAVLAVGLLLLNHFRPDQSSKEPLSNQQNETDTGLAAAENPVPPNDMPAIQPVPVLARSNVPVQIEAAPLQIPRTDDLYRALRESNDPQEKRSLRKQIAALKPGRVPFHFALEKYAGATTDEEKLHLQSIVGQIDVSAFVSEVAKIASETSDESLFVSLAYALRNSTNTLAKQELLSLAANNKLPSRRPDSVMSNQGLVALHRCLLDGLQPSDLVWINEYLQAHSLNPAQERILADYVAKTERAISRP